MATEATDDAVTVARRAVMAPVYALVSCPGTPESCVAAHVNEAERALDELEAAVTVRALREAKPYLGAGLALQQTLEDKFSGSEMEVREFFIQWEAACLEHGRLVEKRDAAEAELAAARRRREGAQ